MLIIHEMTDGADLIHLFIVCMTRRKVKT